MANTRVPAAAGGMPKIMNRRDAPRTIGTGAALGAVAAGTLHAAVSVAAEPDPILSAIDAHQRAYDAWQGLENEDDPRGTAFDMAEQAAWDRVCQTPPTTLYGIARMASYVQRHLTRDACASDQSIEAAWVSIATAAAALDAASRRAG